jgi:hypothetical protein
MNREKEILILLSKHKLEAREKTRILRFLQIRIYRARCNNKKQGYREGL